MRSVAIVGAGMAGLTLAKTLSSDFKITVFEKSAKPGGRVASQVNHHAVFDHGAQFFFVKTAEFRQFFQPTLKAGVITNWLARFIEIEADTIVRQTQWDKDYPHYVGTPSMAAIGQWLAQNIDVRYNTRIEHIEKVADGWQLSTDESELSERFDWVILTAPLAQTRDLLPAITSFKAELDQISMLPCFALMLELKQSPELEFDAALVRESNISWMSNNQSKPDRTYPSMVIHAANQWAAQQVAEDKSLDEVKQTMLATVIQLTGIKPDLISHSDIKYWAYANVDKQHTNGYFVDTDNAIAACGDWCIQGRIEAAFTSANKLAQHLTTLTS